MPKSKRKYGDRIWWKRYRNEQRKKNYESGRFGCRVCNVGKKKGFSEFEKWLIVEHLISDRKLAELLGSSTNSIQSMRWRIKKEYSKRRLIITCFP